MKPIKMILSLGAACAAVTAGAVAAAPIYPDFTVDTSALGGGGTLGTFIVNDISGQYHEQLTFTSASTFAVSLDFMAQGFNYDDTNAAASQSLTATQTGLGSNYEVLAILNGTGTYTTSGGNTTFSLDPGGDLTVSYDAGANASFSAPATPGGSFTINANGDTITTLATGSALTGNGSVQCSAPNLCGAFGQETSFALTPAGATFFIAPNPFYALSLQSGQVEGFPIVEGETVTTSGTLNAVFGSLVPEPAPLTMMGVALAGFLAMRSRKPG